MLAYEIVAKMMLNERKKKKTLRMYCIILFSHRFIRLWALDFMAPLFCVPAE